MLSVLHPLVGGADRIGWSRGAFVSSENFGKGGFEPLRSAIGIFDDLEWQREVDLALYFF